MTIPYRREVARPSAGPPHRGQMLACVVQVYFEQFLPTDDSWPKQFGLETERFRVL